MPTALRSAIRRLATALAVTGLAAFAPRTAAAQLNSPAPSSDKGEQLLPVAGAQYGAPERFAAILGFALANGGIGEPRSGYAFIADAGQGGARASVATFSHAPTGLGAQVRLSAIRTWRTSIVVAPNQTFFGPELRISLTALTVGVGYYWRTAGTAPGDNRFAAATFSVEF